MQQEAPPSSEIPISGAPACDRLHPIIFGRSQILPSRPLFTVAYLINLFTPKVLEYSCLLPLRNSSIKKVSKLFSD